VIDHYVSQSTSLKVIVVVQEPRVKRFSSSFRGENPFICYIRPHAEHFLERAAELYEIGVFTAAEEVSLSAAICRKFFLK
jgi:NLI interacting factor-like phosphatase